MNGRHGVMKPFKEGFHREDIASKREDVRKYFMYGQDDVDDMPEFEVLRLHLLMQDEIDLCESRIFFAVVIGVPLLFLLAVQFIPARY